MTCANYHELMSADMDGELGAEEALTLFSHLSGCAECRQWRQDQFAIRTELRNWPYEALPPGIAEAPAVVSPTPRSVYRIPRVWAWAAAILLLVQSAVSVGTFASRSTEAPMAFEDEADTAETITLTDDDRIRFALQSNPIKIPTASPERNGG